MEPTHRDGGENIEGKIEGTISGFLHINYNNKIILSKIHLNNPGMIM
jgi:hypothetical protein